jgi:hypothetical protein
MLTYSLGKIKFEAENRRAWINNYLVKARGAIIEVKSKLKLNNKWLTN